MCACFNHGQSIADFLLVFWRMGWAGLAVLGSALVGTRRHGGDVHSCDTVFAFLRQRGARRFLTEASRELSISYYLLERYTFSLTTCIPNYVQTQTIFG